MCGQSVAISRGAIAVEMGWLQDEMEMRHGPPEVINHIVIVRNKSLAVNGHPLVYH